MLSSLFIVFSLILAFLIFQYTPMKSFVLRYSRDLYEYEASRMEQRIDDLNAQIEAQELLIKKRTSLLHAGDSLYKQDSIAEAQNDVHDHGPHAAHAHGTDAAHAHEGHNHKATDTISSVPSEEQRALRETVGDALQAGARATRISSDAEQDESFLDARKLFPPINGMISMGFDPIKKHFGVDILSEERTPVKAIYPGVVITSDWTLEGGNTITILHAHDLVSVYKHNALLLKKKGDYVQTGEAIGLIGNTGMHSNGPHLHFELWHEGKALNPTDYFRFTYEMQ